MKRRDFLKAAGLGAVAAAGGCLKAAGRTASEAGAAGKAAEGRANVILILADDVSHDMYGCYGNAEVKTPHIDRMAREGVAFKTAWATPMCSPTRAMLMTGRYASRTKFYHNALRLLGPGEEANLVRDHLTFGKVLKQAGYATAIAGKWHVTGDPPYAETAGFDEHSLWSGPKELAKLPGAPKFTGLWEDDATPSRYWHPCIVQNGKLLATRPEDFGTALHTDFLCSFLERKRDEPFLAYFAMAAPHGTRKGHATNPLRGKVGDMEPESREEGEARFASLNEFIDACVGRILAQVERLGLADRTIVIFTSDNGTAVTAKTRAVERGCRVPLVVWGGGVKARGMSQELTDLTDILPTLLDFAGVRLPEGYQIDGHSLAPYLRGKTERHSREWVYSYIGTSQMVRDKRWLLEAVNPILGLPRGRFYDTRGNRDGKGYRDVTNSEDPDVVAARKRFDEILKRFPAVRKDHPFFETRRGKKFLAAYTEPAAVEKHLNHHKDYRYELVE